MQNSNVNLSKISLFRSSEIPERSRTLTIVRVAAAYAVLYSHSFAMLRLPQPMIAPDVNLGSLALFTFFAISGYLVWISWERSARPTTYAANRFLRIYPGLVTNVLFTALVLGPLLTTLPLRHYFSAPQLFGFLRENLLPWGFYPELPGLFETNPYPGAVNGSLWTIDYEILMYVLVFGVGWLVFTGRVRKTAAAWALFALSALAWTAGKLADEHAILKALADLTPLGFTLHGIGMLAPFFWSGVLFALYRHRIRLNAGMAILAALALLAASTSLAFVPVAWLALPYLLLYVGFARPLQVVEAKNDYSYGIYLYAWPTQQAVVTLGVVDWASSLALSTVLTAALAMVSWHFVESPALGLKRFFPSRGSQGASPVR